jgi:hypothetical protein
VTKRIGETVVIEVEPDAPCAFCKQVRELRPYGPNGESICFECGMLDEPTTKAQMAKMLFGEVDS